MNGMMNQICTVEKIDSMVSCRVSFDKRAYLVGQGQSQGLPQRGHLNIKTPFQIGSVSKLLTACIVLILEKQGIVSLQMTVSDVLGDLWGECSGITLGELITHRSGIRGETGYRGVHLMLSSDEAFGTIEYEIRSNYKDRYRGKYFYCGINFRIVQAMLEKVVGWGFEETLQRYLCEPLEMKATSADVRKLAEYGPVQGTALMTGL